MNPVIELVGDPIHINIDVQAKVDDDIVSMWRWSGTHAQVGVLGQWCVSQWGSWWQVYIYVDYKIHGMQRKGL